MRLQRPLDEINHNMYGAGRRIHDIERLNGSRTFEARVTQVLINTYAMMQDDRPCPPSDDAFGHQQRMDYMGTRAVFVSVTFSDTSSYPRISYFPSQYMSPHLQLE